MSSISITEERLETLKRLGLVTETVSDPLIIYFARGDDKVLPSNFVIKVCKTDRGMFLTCPDMHALARLMNCSKECLPTELSSARTRVIEIDDSGCGFPMLGVLCGLHDSLTNTTLYGEVPLCDFQTSSVCKKKKYLDTYANVAMELVNDLLPKADPSDPTILIRICVGYMNERARDKLRSKGFAVWPACITGVLQDALEEEHRRYVLGCVGSDIYFDAKKVKMDGGARALDEKFRQVMKFAHDHNLMHLCKTGWKHVANA